MKAIRPVLDLLRRPWLEFKARTLCPLAPADAHLPLMLALADMEARRA